MGKTTLAQLVYNDQEVQQKFEKRTWWACISDISDEKEVLGKIFQSITEENYQNLDMRQLESGIRDSISENKKFLLVLDNVWNECRVTWLKIMSLFSGVAKGSKIIVTTRNFGVARALDAEIHALAGLSEDKSWELFKRVAFTREQEADFTWTSLGREILKKCANVPLAIKSIGSLLYEKSTIQEWETFNRIELSQIAIGYNRTLSPIAALKLSYDHLNSNLKHCFAYCSLFPKDYRFLKEKLIQLWISQGYVHVESSKGSQILEDVGHMYFMELLRMSFFQEVVRSPSGEIFSCKMHDLLHDLAMLVAGPETVAWLRRNPLIYCPIRHLAIDCKPQMSPLSLPNVKQLRSLLIFEGSLDLSILDQRITKFRFLRALDLQSLYSEKVSSSIGELIHLRYLNLSRNNFKDLPDSITRLLNLHTLDISWCRELESLPNDFRRLVNLRNLHNKECDRLRYMPPGFGELAFLQRLSYFKVGKVTDGGKSSRLDALAGLELRGELRIEYEIEMAPGVGESTHAERSSNFKLGECCGLDALAGLKLRGKLKTEYKSFNDDLYGDEFSLVLVNLEELVLLNYPGMRIRSLPTNLVGLELYRCKKVKHLPTFRCFPRLKKFVLAEMYELEYVEEDEEKNTGGQDVTAAASFDLSVFPCLEELKLKQLPKLKGWSSREGIVEEQEEEEEEHSTSIYFRPPPPPRHMPSFPLLIELNINDCPELELGDWNWDSLSSLRQLTLDYLQKLELLDIKALTYLLRLQISDCNQLKKVCLPPAVEELMISDCKELELWEEEKRGLHWDSLPNLCTLDLNNMPKPERLPDCLQQRQALGRLEISFHDFQP